MTEKPGQMQDQPQNTGTTQVLSAPSSKANLLAPEPSTNVEAMKRSNSCVETKYKCAITSEKLSRLRKTVESAVKEHKVFTIKGGWGIIRRELLKRNWVEKYESVITRAKSVQSGDDLTSNLPVKQAWESPAAYVEKCEKTIMSRMLQSHDVDFYWSMRKEPVDMAHRANIYKLINKFSKSLFSSKEGLSLLLQQSYWYTEPKVSSINYPRCYVLGFPDHFSNFVEDFRLTACMGILKWLVHTYDHKDKYSIQSPEGEVPYGAVEFAMQRCSEFCDIKKHLDIDKTYERVWDHEWEQFMSHYYALVHQNGRLAENKEHPILSSYTRAKNTLIEMQKFWPELAIDGMRNIWIMKPGNRCRGKGIQLIKSIADVEKVMALKQLKYVVQKYIEKPLLIYNTKFDIRQWFLVANTQPLTIWMYRDCYLRFSGQIFALDNFHESLHLTNHAVQCKYTNVEQRHQALPPDNMWDSQTFQTYLKQIGCKSKWEEVIHPGMREGIICAMLASQEVMDRRQNTYELYGADFMISDDFRPWLIEINCNPDLSSSTSVTSRMCPQCLEDVIKVMVDRRRDPAADTGLFELVYRQVLPRVPPYLGVNLSVRGRKLFKQKIKLKQSPPPQPQQRKEPESPPPVPPYLYYRKSASFNKQQPESRRCSTAPTSLPKIESSKPYTGPIIEDFIDQLNKSTPTPREGVEFTPMLKPSAAKKKIESGKRERVARKGRSCKVNINKINFVCRKQNVKENVKEGKKKELGLFNEWASRLRNDAIDRGEMDDEGWERETVSILKGKNVLGGDFGNKICFKPRCFHFNANCLLNKSRLS